MTDKSDQTLNKLPDGTFTLAVTISRTDIQKKYQTVLASAKSSLNLKGFRPGNIPDDIALQHLDQNQLLDQAVSQAISEVYTGQIAQNRLHPIISPQVKIINPPLATDKDCQVEITCCETPPITLDSGYLDEIKKITSKDQKAIDSAIAEALIKHSQVPLPAVLVDSETNYRLSQLVDQTTQAGISLNDYFRSKNTTLEAYKTTIKNQMTAEWKISLAVEKIANEQNLKVTPEELKAYQAQNPQAAQYPNIYTYILLQQKVFRHLAPPVIVTK